MSKKCRIRYIVISVLSPGTQTWLITSKHIKSKYSLEIFPILFFYFLKKITTLLCSFVWQCWISDHCLTQATITTTRRHIENKQHQSKLTRAILRNKGRHADPQNTWPAITQHSNVCFCRSVLIRSPCERHNQLGARVSDERLQRMCNTSTKPRRRTMSGSSGTLSSPGLFQIIWHLTGWTGRRLV